MGTKSPSSTRGSIVVVGATKGGVGKSSLAWEIAQGYARTGTQTCLIDGDETATVATMYTHRMNGHLSEGPCATVVIAPDHIERTVVDLARGNELVVVDLGARDWNRYQSLPLVADLWIVPTNFSSANMAPAAQLYAEHFWPKNGRHQSGGPVPVRLAWCQTPNNSGNPARLERCLAWWEDAIKVTTSLDPPPGRRFHPATGFDVFATQLRYRETPWEESLNRGGTLAELPPSIGGKAAAEVEAFLQEVHKALTKVPGGSS